MSQPVWSLDSHTQITLGDVTEAIAVICVGVLAGRHMKTLFALTIFPRMPDDAGVRFAVLTLCRYAVLGLTSLVALGAVHLDLTKIGVVLAALGVGLGFGLQEIVSNFVCGIILLLERPIRIGDTVTVAGTTGTVDRINIRATTIVNGDNQCMIVPNREFITGNLVNWTHKDKIMRLSIKVGVAYGTDPDRVVKLLLAIAGDDADVCSTQHPERPWKDSATRHFSSPSPRSCPTRLGRIRAPQALHRNPATVLTRTGQHPVSDSRAVLEPDSRGSDPSPGNHETTRSKSRHVATTRPRASRRHRTDWCRPPSRRERPPRRRTMIERSVRGAS